jgi:hypothetical protein
LKAGALWGERQPGTRIVFILNVTILMLAFTGRARVHAVVWLELREDHD